MGAAAMVIVGPPVRIGIPTTCGPACGLGTANSLGLGIEKETVSQRIPRAGVASQRPPVDGVDAVIPAIGIPAGAACCWHAAQPENPRMAQLIKIFFIALVPCAVIAAENVCLVDRFRPANTSRILKR